MPSLVYLKVFISLLQVSTLIVLLVLFDTVKHLSV